MNDDGGWTRMVIAEVLTVFCVNFKVGANKLSWWKGYEVCHDEDSEVKKEASVHGIGKVKVGFRLIWLQDDDSTTENV